MSVRTFVTHMPDESGAFLRASRIVAREGGNIVRASYNKAVDLHVFFLDVSADDAALDRIAHGLAGIGYLSAKIAKTRVMVVEVKIPDEPGRLLPVLELLGRGGINISYIDSAADGTGFQRFRLGLLIERPEAVRSLLDGIARLYPIDVVDYDEGGTVLDNTIFYIRLGGEMQRLFGLSDEKTMEFLSESNRVLQELEELREDPSRVFGAIRRFARFVAEHRGENFHADVEKRALGPGVTLYNIQPPCGSNTWVIDGPGPLALIDTGYAVFAPELLAVLRRLFPDFDGRKKELFITHADVDHCGLLSVLDGVKIRLNEKSAQSLRRQRDGLPDNRELSPLTRAYSRLSRLISGYVPPDPARFDVFDSGTPAQHEELLRIGAFIAGGLPFEVWEGSGGHLPGEMALVCRAPGIVFTGDILVNISGFSPERAAFNSLAPYLMRSVNMDSRKARRMRKETAALIERITNATGAPCLICGGHGPLSVLRNGALTTEGGRAETVPAAKE